VTDPIAGGEMNRVKVKVVIITGAGSGFGKLATMGAKTVLAERFHFLIRPDFVS
jgi:hypothetical protein